MSHGNNCQEDMEGKCLTATIVRRTWREMSHGNNCQEDMEEMAHGNLREMTKYKDLLN